MHPCNATNGGERDTWVLETILATPDGKFGKAKAFSNHHPEITGAPDVDAAHGLVR
jgi:hypothetical protein